eukprot:3593250-Rhodomonas_salina.1
MIHRNRLPQFSHHGMEEELCITNCTCSSAGMLAGASPRSATLSSSLATASGERGSGRRRSGGSGRRRRPGHGPHETHEEEPAHVHDLRMHHDHGHDLLAVEGVHGTLLLALLVGLHGHEGAHRVGAGVVEHAVLVHAEARKLV